MSSFKNARKSLQKTHKERGQPGQRKHFGLLEKHKDYVLRAKDFHRKEAKLKLLREKARNKNPDEFYYKMVNTKLSNGVHVVERKKSYSADQLKMIKSQDLNYTRMKRVMERNKIAKLKSSLHFPQEGNLSNSHTVFVDSRAEAKSFDAVTHFKTTSGLVKCKYNRLRADQLEENPTLNKKGKVKVGKVKKRAYEELAKRVEREKHLSAVEQGMELQKHLMGKGRRRKMTTGEDGPVVYRWKRQRKK